MVNRTWIELVLVGIVIIYLMAVLSACSYRHQPKGYICIEKPPIKITYMDYHKDITPTTVGNLIRQARAIPYQNCKVNERSEVDVNYNSSISHDTSASKNLSLSSN